MAAVRILGIDPGTVVVGFACLEVVERSRPTATGGLPLAQRAGNVVTLGSIGAASDCSVLEVGVWRLGRGKALAARLGALSIELEAALDRLRPDELALEEAFFGKSVQSAMRVGEARGVVLASGHRHGVQIHEYPPARIKRAVAGSGNASKETVAAFTARQLGLASIDGPSDASDALATALCRVEERRGFAR
ncbi:MAG: crossover junction endodeoxyribonuclease RuvC [Planctomycetes bacterium]|nr:crossover junction endodeoxyribonuclease RuvC [Planctomycetota bacterium]